MSTLTNVAIHKIVLEDNSQYFYSTEPYELTNVLGNVVAVLQAYHFTKHEDNNSGYSCKLYKTREGNWYEINEPASSADYNILWSLKTAIERQENGFSKFTFPK
ncbi:MAG: hypothetical protein ABI863_09965 [Ginsengibacter sp.]